MRPAEWKGRRRGWLLPAAALILTLTGPAAGCSSGSSSKPDYCTDASQLKTSVQNLGNVNVAANGLGSLQTALTKIQTDARSFATAAKSAYPSETAALNSALSGLQNAITSAKAQPSVTAVAAVTSSVTQVKNSASALQSALKAKC